MNKKAKQALPFKRGNTFYAPPESVFIPGVDDEEDHYLTDEDRRLRQPDENMVRNAMVHGILQAVVVTKEGERVTCVAGQRRLLAAREANIRLLAEGKQPISVEVKVKRGTPGELFGVYISENEHRKDESVLSKARKAERMRGMGQTDEEISIAFGASGQTLRNWKKVLELDHRVLKMVAQGEIEAFAAVGFHGLEPDDQYNKACELLEESGGKKPSRKRVERKVDPDAIKAPAKGLILKMVKAYEEHDEAGDHFTQDFLMGMKYARGLISALDAGVEPALVALSRPKKQETSEKDPRIAKKPGRKQKDA